MRIYLIVSIIGIALQPGSLKAQPHEDPGGFALGELVGRCLVARCQIIRAALLTDTPVSGRAVRMRVEEQIFGPPVAEETLELPYVNPREFVKSYDSLHAAWGVGGGVQFSYNAPVLAARALEPIPGVGQAGPLLVTSNSDILATTRLLVAEAARLEAVPNGVSNEIASLSRRVDGPLAGFLFVYLTKRVTLKDPDLETALLGQMIGSPSVPSLAFNDIVAFMG